MNVLILGCEKVGSALATVLDGRGHDVSVIDKNSVKFESLPPDFGGFTTPGVPIDQGILKRAGIETCDALFAVTDEDDMNIMASQLAKQVFNVPKIFARITDISKGNVYEKLGINVICPTKLTVNAACAALEEDDGSGRELNFGSSTVHFSTIDVPEKLIGKTPADITYENDEVLFGILRQNSGLIMYSGQPVSFIAGDKFIFAKKA